MANDLQDSTFLEFVKGAVNYIIIGLLIFIASTYRIVIKALFEKMFDERIKDLKEMVTEIKIDVQQLKADKELKEKVAKALEDHLNKRNIWKTYYY